MPVEQTDTIIGAHVELKGSLHNSGPIHIHGRITGDVASDSIVVIGETAIVTGPIVAKQVDVSGQVHGSITAEELIELQPKSFVKGDLACNRLSIKPGAVFVGKSQMSTPHDLPNPNSEEERTDRKKPRMEIE
jgi:cytoskeletal protein CcmA (bactofilin family)